MPEMKTLNGYEVVDAKAREEIKSVKEAVDNIEIPEMPDLTPYATETYVDNAIDNIPGVDLSKHALKSELPTKVSQLQNDSKFITREEVPKTDLSEYAKKSEIPDVSDFITNIPSEYITESELNAKGYATGGYVDSKVAGIVMPDLEPYAKKTDIPTVPNKVSAFDNDAGYLTQHQSLTAYAKKEDIPDISTKADVNHRHDNLYEPKGAAQAVKDDLLGGASTAYDTLRELGTLIIDNQDAIEALETIASGKADKNHTHSEYLTEHQDLSAYAKKSDIPTVPTVPTKVSELTNDAGYVTAEDIPDGVDTSNLLKFTTVNDQYNWYVATTNKHQVIQNDMPVEKMDTDLDRVISGKTLNNNSIAVREGLQLRVPVTPTKDNHAASKNYIDTKVAGIKIPTKVSELANDKNYITSIPSEYVTESELNAKGYLTEHQDLSEYAKKSDIPEGQDLSQYAKKTDIPDISGKADKVHSHPEYLTEHQDLSEYAKKSDIPEGQDLSKYALKTDIPDVSDFISEIPSEYITETELNSKGYLTQHQSLDGKADKVHEHIEYADKTHKHSMADITDYEAPEIPSLDGYATEKYVDDAINNVEHPTFFLDFSDAVSYPSKSASEEMIRFGEYAGTSDDYSVFLRDTTSGEENYYFPALVQKSSDTQFAFSKASINMNTVAQNKVLTWDVLILVKTAGEWKYHKAGSANTTIATKTYVDDAVAGIEIPEGGDLTGYATIDYVDDKAVTNAAAIAAIETRVGDLEDAGYITSIPSTYITESELAAKGYTTKTASDAAYMSKSDGQQCQADIAAIEAAYITMNNFPVMTQSQYNALSSKDSNKFYFIKES